MANNILPDPETIAKFKRRAPNKGATWIYIIGMDQPTPPVKIGIAQNVKARLGTLQTGSPVPLKVHHSCEVGTRARRLEGILHRRFYDRCVSGEWFNITPAEANDELQRLMSRHQTISAREARREKPVKALVVDDDVQRRDLRYGLTDADIKAIRYSGNSACVVGAAYGIKPDVVFKIRTWRLYASV